MTAGLWRRVDGRAEYTRADRNGRAPVLSLETACECLTAEWIYADDESAPDLESHRECEACDGGWLHSEHQRSAAELWEMLHRPTVPVKLLGQLAVVCRLAGWGLTWRSLPDAARGRAA